MSLVDLIESRVNIEEYIHYKRHVGVDGAHFIGLPGSGKTSMGNRVVKDCIKEKNENFLIAGDRFCEFRHFFRYHRILNKIVLFLPDNQDVYCYGLPGLHEYTICRETTPEALHRAEEKITEKYGLPFEIKIINYDTFVITDYLTNKTEKTLFVIYDNHYQGIHLHKRAELWKNIVKQLLERTVLINSAVGIIWHEAGILFPQGALDKHWKEVNQFAELLVECRKGLVRTIFISQLETEIEHTIRQKLLVRVYKYGTTSKRAPIPVQKSAPFQARDEFILVYGGYYSTGNRVMKFAELEETWKIVPVGELRVASDSAQIVDAVAIKEFAALFLHNMLTQSEKPMKGLQKQVTNTLQAMGFKISQQTISKYYNKLAKNPTLLSAGDLNELTAGDISS